MGESYAGLSKEMLQEPGVTGGWAVKDVLAHVSWWEEEALKHLPHILEGGRPPRYSTLYGGIDAFNARMHDTWRGRSLAEVLTRLAASHLRLLEYLDSVPEGQLLGDTRFRLRLRLDTYGHYAIHAAAILEWRARRGTTSG